MRVPGLEQQAFAALLLLALAPASATKPPTAEEAIVEEAIVEEAIVAVYRGGTVTRGEYANWLRHQGVEAGAEPRWPQVRKIALTESLAAAAEARGAHHEATLHQELTAARNRALIAALMRHVRARIEISDDEVETYYRQNPEAFRRPRKVALANLYKKLPRGPQATAEVRRAMAALRQELVEGADFTAVARRESDSHTRYQGGYIGFVEAGQLAPEIDVVAMRLAPGEISEILETGDGLTILHCKSITPAHIPSPEEVRGKLRQNLRRLRFEQSWQALQSELRENAEATLDDDTLAAHEAERLGLAAEPDVASQLHWRRLEPLARAEMRRRVDQALTRPSEKEIRDFHEARKAHFLHPEQWRLSAIRFDPGKSDRGQQQGLAERLLEGLRAGELAFANAAREHSNHPSSRRGGDLGWLRRPEIAALGSGAFQAIRELEPGELSRVLYFEPALWILRLEEKRQRQAMSLTEARDAIAAKLTAQRTIELQKELRRNALRQLELRRAD